ncbi:hypothetical protein B9G98_00081 [Wickerhamiella sorbophila]|uniref:Uncharacterized protein n=1 Tax=Wickerhamiella sorbophila TaxID=45607 RepID=A0A2T0FBW1_9ASCO|nr:hypothetical protein B9G98_00081 [Wickerhamiella sorbophila]PRT52461.1 hypothetical protein B9G98_00081 [Wickerhamiella sorbophila]
MLSRFSAEKSVLVAGRPVVFQLVLVQTVYDRGESFEGVAQVVNDHPLLVAMDSPVTDDQAKEVYEAMLDHYNARVDGPGKKKGRSKQIELLAHLVFGAYVQELLSLVKDDQEEFQRVYKESEELMHLN